MASGKQNLNVNIAQNSGNFSSLEYSESGMQNGNLVSQSSQTNKNLFFQTSQENNNLSAQTIQQTVNLGGSLSKASHSVCPECQMNMNSNIQSSQKYKLITGKNLYELNNSLCPGCGRMTVEHF